MALVAHRSRLSTILIDAPSGEAAAVAAFWSQALGVPARTVNPDEEQFTSLRGALPELGLAVQAVDDQARYHLDIETDDVEAETRRLIGLGAVEVGRWLDCRTLRAPGGHLVCVIPRHSDPEIFERLSQVWE
jgi:Glyoxalase-like domain